MHIFFNMLESDSLNSRGMWSIVNDMLSHKPSNEPEKSYKHQTNDEPQIATGFIQYFQM